MILAQSLNSGAKKLTHPLFPLSSAEAQFGVRVDPLCTHLGLTYGSSPETMAKTARRI